ncbi:hypothetical protein [Paractinoplanes hotanensis]|uniref:Secreted protein n=1 Tax=Paractinoplanes hotanensis TaxID=2906497 RepID=A0ABT0YD19_9ACTN|nr:hypothetical protein [Actinoplanes hotanensis]MCM4083645.1 hypothetical protein [Actinoplanes hotanensis]
MTGTTGKLARAATSIIAGAAVIVSVPEAAAAASRLASEDGFDRTGACDAIVGVSDETSSGNIEVYGGFSCPTDSGLWNTPEPTTIRVRLFRNGNEIIQSKKNSATCFTGAGVEWTCSTDSHSVTYPDYSGNDSFYGRIEIVSFSGNSTLTTGSITS